MSTPRTPPSPARSFRMDFAIRRRSTTARAVLGALALCVLPPSSGAAAIAAGGPATPRLQDGTPAPSLEAARALTMPDMARRRDLWPARVKLTQTARLDGSTQFPAGSELPLESFDGTTVVLDDGTFLFEWPATNTDVVERIRSFAASLSPEALALTVDELAKRPELWPTRLALTHTLRFDGNVVVPAGREVTLRFFQDGDLSVYDREVKNHYIVEPHQTDVMAAARARLSLPREARTPFFLRSIAGALESPAPAVLERLERADYVLVFAGRLGCTRCASFAPELEPFVERARAAHPEARFEIVTLSEDPDAASAAKYAAEHILPGGRIAFERRLEAANLMELPLQLLPGLFVFDRNGALVDRNHPNGGSPSAHDVLARFEARL